MATTGYQVAYRAGRCARCDQSIEGSTSDQEVLLQVIGPASVVTIHCWLDRHCQPEPADVPAISRELAMRLVDWYRSNPSARPIAAGVDHA